MNGNCSSFSSGTVSPLSCSSSTRKCIFFSTCPFPHTLAPSSPLCEKDWISIPSPSNPDQLVGWSVWRRDPIYPLWVGRSPTHMDWLPTVPHSLCLFQTVAFQSCLYWWTLSNILVSSYWLDFRQRLLGRGGHLSPRRDRISCCGCPYPLAVWWVWARCSWWKICWWGGDDSWCAHNTSRSYHSLSAYSQGIWIASQQTPLFLTQSGSYPLPSWRTRTIESISNFSLFIASSVPASSFCRVWSSMLFFCWWFSSLRRTPSMNAFIRPFMCVVLVEICRCRL